MKVFTREELRWLAQRQETPQVSILMPVDPVGERVTSDPVRLKSLLARAKSSLMDQRIRGPQAEELLQPAIALMDDAMFWKQDGRGLAIYLNPGFSRIYRVPTSLPEWLEVGTQFQLKPLFPLVQEDGSFFVLAVSADACRVLQCTRDTVARLHISRLPKNLAEATQWTEETGRGTHRHSNMNPGTARKGRGYGTVSSERQGFGDDANRRKDDYTDYFLRIDHALRAALAGERAPMVFAGVERWLPLYAEHATYPGLLSEGLHGNFEEVSDRALRDRAWKLVQPFFQHKRWRDERRLWNLAGTGLASHDLTELLEGALYGRIDTLFVAQDRQVMGLFDHQRIRIEVHDPPQPGDHELLNELTLLALVRGAAVYAVPLGELPMRENGAAANAILRW